MIEHSFEEPNKEELLAAMRLGVENAKTDADKYLATKNLLQMELAINHVDGDPGLSTDEWIERYGGFLSMVIEESIGLKNKMIVGRLSQEEKVDIVSRAREMYLESLN